MTGVVGAGDVAAANSYVFGAGVDSESDIFGLQRYVSKSAPSSAVVDTSAFGRMYASAVSLAKFEENFGQTNTSTVRLELNATFGTERTDAAIRIAAA